MTVLEWKPPNTLCAGKSIDKCPASATMVRLRVPEYYTERQSVKAWLNGSAYAVVRDTEAIQVLV